MKIRTAFFALAFSLFICFETFAIEDLFVNATLEQVETQAARDGKLYMIDFYAHWCLPCKWMDETTFSDPQVVDYLKENYIPLKVNIDDFDGFGIKEKYEVAVLPTLILFNSSGQLVERVEESLTPTKLLSILVSHNTANNRIRKKIMEPIIEAPDYEIPVITSEEEPKTEYSIADKKKANPIHKKNEIAWEDTGLFEFSVRQRNRTGYALQMGVFAEYGNVLREAAKMEAKYGKTTLVHISKLNGATVYRLMISDFSTREKAQLFVNLLNDQGIQALVKDLSSL